MAFLGGSGEELEIPEENALDLQTVQVCDQSHRETTGDFLDSDAIKLSPMDREAQYERKHTKTKSKAHRKAKRKHAEKSKTTARDKSNQDYDVYNEITNYILGAKTLNLAKATQTVLDDIAEISSSKESDSNNKTPKAKLVPADQDGEKKTADAKSEDVVEIDLHEANKEALVTERFYDTNKESVHERTLNFQDETDQWQTLCESLQTYTFDAEYDDDDHPTDSAQCKSWAMKSKHLKFVGLLKFSSLGQFVLLKFGRCGTIVVTRHVLWWQCATENRQVNFQTIIHMVKPSNKPSYCVIFMHWSHTFTVLP